MYHQTVQSNEVVLEIPNCIPIQNGCVNCIHEILGWRSACKSDPPDWTVEFVCSSGRFDIRDLDGGRILHFLLPTFCDLRSMLAFRLVGLGIVAVPAGLVSTALLRARQIEVEEVKHNSKEG